MTFYYDKIFNIIEFWVFGMAIIFPVIIALCKSAQKGDNILNELLNNNENK